jgi:phage shock protein C
MEKKLYRSAKDVMLAGVLSGFAEYFKHDAILWRFGFIVFLILTGFMPGVLIYALAWILIPKNPLFAYKDVTNTQT